MNDEMITALKNARLAKGLTQRKLAELTGLPQSHISKIESGAVDIQLSSLTEMARVLELEPKLVPRKALIAVESIIRHVQSGSKAPYSMVLDSPPPQRPAYAFDDDD